MRLLSFSTLLIATVALISAPAHSAPKKKSSGDAKFICISSGGAFTARAKCLGGETKLNASLLAKLISSSTKAAVNSLDLPEGQIGPQGIPGSKGDTGASFYEPIPSGKTISGIIGGDFERSGSYWAYASFPTITPLAITNKDVIVASNSTILTYCGGTNGCINAEEKAADVSSLCTGSITNPTAPAGKVCVYISEIGNAEDLIAVAVPWNSTRRGIALRWIAYKENGSDTYVEGVWAYTAP